MSYNRLDGNKNSSANTQPLTERVYMLLQYAILRRDPQARNDLQQEWVGHVHKWINAHPLVSSSKISSDVDSITRASFAAFWQQITGEKLRSLLAAGTIMLYLKSCVHAILASEERLLQRQLIADGDDGEDWTSISTLLTDEQERVLVSLHYGQHLSLLEISQVRSDLFPTEGTARSVQRQVIQRLASRSSCCTFQLEQRNENQTGSPI